VEKSSLDFFPNSTDTSAVENTVADDRTDWVGGAEIQQKSHDKILKSESSVINRGICSIGASALTDIFPLAQSMPNPLLEACYLFRNEPTGNPCPMPQLPLIQCHMHKQTSFLL